MRVSVARGLLDLANDLPRFVGNKTKLDAEIDTGERSDLQSVILENENLRRRIA